MKANPYSRSRPQKLNAGMNVVPYIDVMLVLLVIYGDRAHANDGSRY